MLDMLMKFLFNEKWSWTPAVNRIPDPVSHIASKISHIDLKAKHHKT